MSKKKHWESWALRDPYFAVLSSPGFRGAELESVQRERFLASGEAAIAETLAEAETYFGPLARVRALDYGCGVGRLLPPLAARFSAVQGADISRAMLEKAANNCRDLGNVELVDTGAGERPRGPFDFVHSCLVFQHIPWRDGINIISALAHQLAPGGVAAIEIPFLRDVPAWRRVVHLARNRFRIVHLALNAAQRLPLRDPPMLMNPYPLSRLIGALQGTGIETFRIRTRTAGSYHFAFLFFQAPSRR